MELRFLIILLLSILSLPSGFSQNTELRGIGVAFHRKAIKDDSLLANKMILFGSKDLSNEIGYFKFNEVDRFDLGVVGPNHHSESFFEFDYELFGLPIVNLDVDYIEVVYGYDEESNALTGFIKPDSTNYGWLVWKEYLLDIPIFFKDRFSDPDVYNKKNGKKIPISIPFQSESPRRKDYIMYPQRIEGKWMEVELISPSDYCVEPEEVSKRKLWIKYLDDECELRVWYYTRGC